MGLTKLFAVYRQTPGTDFVTCLVCPTRTGDHWKMHKKHVQKHDETNKHQNYLKSKQNSYALLSNPSLAGPCPTLVRDLGFNLDETYHSPGVVESHQISEGLCDVPMDDLEPLSFGDLWGSTFGNRTYTIGECARDYFQEAVDSLQNGVYQFSFSRPLSLRGEELGLETEEGGFGGEEGGFGIDIPGKFYQRVDRKALLIPYSHRRLSYREL